MVQIRHFLLFLNLYLPTLGRSTNMYHEIGKLRQDMTQIRWFLIIIFNISVTKTLQISVRQYPKHLRVRRSKIIFDYPLPNVLPAYLKWVLTKKFLRNVQRTLLIMIRHVF